MDLSRRNFMAGIGAVMLAPTLPRPAIAQTKFGTGIISTLSDGNLTLPKDFFFAGLPEPETSQILAQFGIANDQIEPECNLALYQTDGRNILFDIGSGPDFMPTAGRLLESLDMMGLYPEDITDVVFTHAHPDHIWGVLDDFDDVLLPEAQFFMGQAEWDYWWRPETVVEVGDALAAFAVGAKRRMQAIEDRITQIQPGTEFIPGIAAIKSFGHTPGHLSFELHNGGQSALVIGDAIGNHHVGMRHPEWVSGADQIPDQAIQSRHMLLDRLANEHMLAIGFHLPGGGMGQIDRHAGGYRFVQGG